MASQRIVVPAFFPLGATYTNDSGETRFCWNDMEAFGGAGPGGGPPNVNLIVAERSFPGLSTQNPDEAARARFVFDLCRNIYDFKVLGYVSTRNGTRPIQDIENDIQDWYRVYPANIDGMFFDEGPRYDNSAQGFYTQLLTNFSSAHSGHIAYLNAAQYPNEWIMSLAHYVNLWEEALPTYEDQLRYGALVLDPNGNEINMGVPTWWTDLQYTARISHIVHSCPDAQAMRRTINLSRARGVGNLYVYDGTSGSYGRLPRYWQEETIAARTP